MTTLSLLALHGAACSDTTNSVSSGGSSSVGGGSSSGGTGHVGNAGGGGRTVVAGSGGDSGLNESGATGDGSDPGAAGADGEATCAQPQQGGCPDNLVEFDGQKADLTAHCWGQPVPLSCGVGATGAETCWRNVVSGDYYRLSSGPCLPSADWRQCTADEKAATYDSITQDCN